MKRSLLVALTLASAAAVSITGGSLISAQETPNLNVPRIPFDSAPDFLKYSADMNLGEVLAVAVNSKGRIVVLNHPGSATAGPIYGNASTQLLEFDSAGK